MKKPFRHAGLLMIMGIIALGLVGAAYTLWYEDLSISANVTTARFDVDWSCQTGFAATTKAVGTGVSANQTCGTTPTKQTVAILTSAANVTNPTLIYTDFTDNGDDLTAVPAAKYIQTCSAAITGSGGTGANDTGTFNILTLTLSNLYPFAGCKFAIDIDVPSGNYVPAHFTMTANTNTLGALGVLSGSTGTCAQIAAELNSPTAGNLVINNNANTAPLQLHANERIFCTFLVYLKEILSDSSTVLENQSAGTYTLTATIKAHQFNEPAP